MTIIICDVYNANEKCILLAVRTTVTVDYNLFISATQKLSQNRNSFTLYCEHLSSISHPGIFKSRNYLDSMDGKLVKHTTDVM
jgi:hypothetical protein